MKVSRSFYRIICLIWWLVAIGMTGMLVSLTGCGSSYTKDGTTVVSYCLLGGVYMDDTRVLAEHKQQSCATEGL